MPQIKSEKLIKYLNDKKIKDFKKIEKGFYCFVIQQWSIFGEITNEKLSYIGKNVDTEKLFDVNESELLVKAVMEIGGKTNHSNLDFQKCAEVAKSLFNDLSSRFGSHVQNYKDEVHDKTTVQIKNLKKHKISQIDIFQNTIETHQNNILLTSDDKRKMTLNNLIKAQKGKIEKIEKKVSEKIAYIQKSTNVTEESSDVTAIFAKIQ